MARATPAPVASILAAAVALAWGVPRAQEGARPPVLGGLGYVEVVTGGAARDARLPLVVALHGLGDRPDSFAAFFPRPARPTRLLFLRAPEPHGAGFAWFAFDRKGRPVGFARAVLAVERAVADAVKRRPTVGRPVVTGFSQGGMLSYALAARRAPIAAAVPVSGYLPEGALVQSFPGPAPAVRAVHGALDAVIPIAKAERAIAELVAAGHEASLEPFPEPHTISADMGRAILEHLEAALDERAR